MFVTFTVLRGGSDPEIGSIVGWTTPPPAFPTMSDVTYNKAFRNIGGGAREYCVGLPVADPDGFIVPGEGVFIAMTRLADVVVTVPVHTCVGYAWFYGQSPVNVRAVETASGLVLIGDIVGGRILIAPVVMV